MAGGVAAALCVMLLLQLCSGWQPLCQLDMVPRVVCRLSASHNWKPGGHSC